jgi:hypothetical protein
MKGEQAWHPFLSDIAFEMAPFSPYDDAALGMTP